MIIRNSFSTTIIKLDDGRRNDGFARDGGISCASHAARSSSYDARFTTRGSTGTHFPNRAVLVGLTNLLGKFLAPDGRSRHQFTSTVTRCPRNPPSFAKTPCQRSPSNAINLFFLTSHANTLSGVSGQSPVAVSLPASLAVV